MQRCCSFTASQNSFYVELNKHKGSMAKRRGCARGQGDTKKLRRALKAKKSGVDLQVKNEFTGMKDLLLYSSVVLI